MLQNWIVGGLVVLALLYSLGYLMPHVARRYLARLHIKLGAAPSCGSGCGSCGKCAGTPAAAPSSTGQMEAQPITFHQKTR